MALSHGSLFNGIAGFPLAAAWAGIETAWTVEIDEFCNKVSKKHFPDAIQYTDIRTTFNLPYVDIISGGFPCQPFSVAGKQLGNEDDRALWPQMLRIIREVKPAYVIGENVTGIIKLALDEVLASLEAEGYTTETFIVPACAVNAPHRRDRVWIVAYANCNTNRYIGKQDREAHRLPGINRSEICSRKSIGTDTRDAPNAACQLPHRSGHTRHRRPELADGSWRLLESPICGRDARLPEFLVRNRGKQLKAYGNSIVPQVAFEFFKVISEIEYNRS